MKLKDYFLFYTSEDNSNNKNPSDVLMLLLLRMQTVFLLQDNAIIPLFGLLIELLFIHGLSYDLKYKRKVLFSLVYKILIAVVGLFFQTFSYHLFLMDNLFFQFILFINGLIFETLAELNSLIFETLSEFFL